MSLSSKINVNYLNTAIIKECPKFIEIMSKKLKRN